jgi:hypothetical protein
MNQQEADIKVKEALEGYLKNSGNSISGTNFIKLITELQMIHHDWLFDVGNFCKEIFKESVHEPKICERTGHLPNFEKGNNTCLVCKQDITDWLKSQSL